MIRALAVLALLCGALPAHAQAAVGKKELVQKILQLQQPGFEFAARNLVEQSAAQLMQGAARVLQAEVPADQREAVAKVIDADIRKYIDEAVPLVRERAVKAAPSTIGTLLEDKFSEEELKQLVAWFDSPVNRKYQALAAEMQKGFVQKVVADSRPAIEPRFQALEQKVRSTLGAAAGPAKAAGSAPRASAP